MSASPTCAACGLALEGAPFCKGCGARAPDLDPFVTPRADATPPAPGTATPESLRTIAIEQRRVLLVLLASMLGIGLTLGGSAVFGAASAEAMGVILIVVTLAIAALRIIFVYRLAVAVGISVGWAVLAALVGIHSFLGLIALVVVNARATKALKQAGLRVGLLGVSAADIARL